jgi:hypothetical protein
MSPAYGLDIALDWDPPDGEQDVLYYNLYYNKGVCGPPFYGSDAQVVGSDPQKDPSPIRVEVNEAVDAPIGGCLTGRICITGLSVAQTYYFAVTAVYDSGAESHYVEQMCWNSKETCWNCPTIVELLPDQCDPGGVVSISGSAFGWEQRESLVSVGRKVFGPGHRKIILWTDTEIRIKLPSYKCRWFKNSDLKMQKIWVTVDRDRDFQDSNEVWLGITKSYNCR